MSRESVVDALNIIHGSLRPGGILLDVHPLGASSSLEIHSKSEPRTLLGQAEYSHSFSETLALAEQSLAEQEIEAKFIKGQHIDFQSARQFTTVEQWKLFRNKNIEDYMPAANSLIEAVNQALATPGTTLVMSDTARATCYRAKS